MTQEKPTFDLWAQPWLTVERQNGSLEQVGLEQLLQEAHHYRGWYEASPLVIVGNHRLLTAVLQEIYAPQTEDDLATIWQAGQFATDLITQFGQKYKDRFNLFSEDAPFLQTADLPLIPPKWGKGKSVGYLFPEQTAGTAVTHYNHLYDKHHTLCSACAAKGLLLIPPFASSGGAGIKPSINGVPPIYILPGGDTLFQSLTASLTVPIYQPDLADKSSDVAWWQRPKPTIVNRNDERTSVGYLHSLTFPARRVRLHPQPMIAPCARCGQQTAWGVPEMSYEMGEFYPKTANIWQDPFAAYRSKGDKPPIPLRPVDGKAVWREFTSLFLPQTNTTQSDKKATVHIRPRIIGQIEQLRSQRHHRRHLPYARGLPIPFQTVGLRTDMKAKIFEWEQNGFQVPPNVLSDADLAIQVEQALAFTTDCNKQLQRVFSTHFGGQNVADERLKPFKKRLSQQFWQQLGDPFRHYILDLGQQEADTTFMKWLDTVRRIGQDSFQQITKMLGENGRSLEKQVKAQEHCARELNKLHQKYRQGVTNE